MIVTAAWIAVITLAGFVVLFYKLPRWLRIFLSRRYILLDILLCVLAFWALSFTLIGIVAAAFMSLMVSAYLLWYKKSADKKNPIIDRNPRSYGCKPHIHWIARLYNWWKYKGERT